MPVGVQCPIASSLGEFPSYLDWLLCPWLSPVLVSIPLPFAFHTWCFPFALICHWISIVFLLYGRRIATHSVDKKNMERFTNLHVILAQGHANLLCIVPILVYVLPKQVRQVQVRQEASTTSVGQGKCRSKYDKQCTGQ